jgi:hypothetical protein
LPGSIISALRAEHAPVKSTRRSEEHATEGAPQ